MKHHVYNKAINQLKDKLWPCKLEKQFVKVSFSKDNKTEVLTENNMINYGCIPIDTSGNVIPEPKKAKDRIKDGSNQPCYKLTIDFKKSPQIIIAIANKNIEYFELSDKKFGINWISLKNEQKALTFEVITIEKNDF